MEPLDLVHFSQSGLDPDQSVAARKYVGVRQCASYTGAHDLASSTGDYLLLQETGNIQQVMESTLGLWTLEVTHRLDPFTESIFARMMPHISFTPDIASSGTRW